MDNLFENFTITILKINKLVQKIKQLEMQQYDLKSIHVMCIYYLNKHRQGLTASELMRLTYEDKAAISRALKQLRDSDYISYNADTYNANIVLTEQGEVIAQEIIDKINKAVLSASAEFTDEQREFFYKSLNAIADNINNYYKRLVNKND